MIGQLTVLVGINARLAPLLVSACMQDFSENIFVRKFPAGIIPPGCSQSSGDVWVSYDFELITPMLGGGAETKKQDAYWFRPSAIRGALQHWWRLLHDETNAQALRDEQRRIWGCEKRAGLVDISVQVTNVPTVGVVGTHNHKGGFRFSNYPYALFGFKPEGNDIPKWVEPGCKFTLHLRCRGESEPSVTRAIKAWANFGGMGARTRRGFGAVYSEKLAFTDQVEIEHFISESPRSSATTSSSLNGVIRPQLVGDFFLAKCADPSDGLTKGLSHLHRFRQGRGFARSQRAGQDKPGQSNWPEALSIRELLIWQLCSKASLRSLGMHEALINGHDANSRTRQLAALYKSFKLLDKKGVAVARAACPTIEFPRAAFGLPIVFEITNEVRKDVAGPNGAIKAAGTDSLKPQLNFSDKSDRLASPILIRPMKWADGTCFLCVMRLSAPPVTSAVLKPGKNDLLEAVTLTSDQLKGRLTAAAHSAAGLPPSPMQGATDGDVLGAFMNYLRKR